MSAQAARVRSLLLSDWLVAGGGQARVYGPPTRVSSRWVLLADLTDLLHAMLRADDWQARAPHLVDESLASVPRTSNQLVGALELRLKPTRHTARSRCSRIYDWSTPQFRDYRILCKRPEGAGRLAWMVAAARAELMMQL